MLRKNQYQVEGDARQYQVEGDAQKKSLRPAPPGPLRRPSAPIGAHLHARDVGACAAGHGRRWLARGLASERRRAQSSTALSFFRSLSVLAVGSFALSFYFLKGTVVFAWVLCVRGSLRRRMTRTRARQSLLGLPLPLSLSLSLLFSVGAQAHSGNMTTGQHARRHAQQLALARSAYPDPEPGRPSSGRCRWLSRARALSLLLSFLLRSGARAQRRLFGAQKHSLRRPRARSGALGPFRTLFAVRARQPWWSAMDPPMARGGQREGAQQLGGRRKKKTGAAKTPKVGVCENRKGAGGCGSQKWFCTERGVGSCAKTGFLYKRGGAVLAQQPEKEGFHLCEDWVTRKQLGQHKHGNVTLRG